MSNKTINGVCGLCGVTSLLKDSHLMPRSLYRLARSKDNKNPALLTFCGPIKQSRQISDYFLCGVCEERFNKNGEKYVLDLCFRGKNTFRLHDLLRTATVNFSSTGRDIRIVEATSVPGIDWEKIAYFAASIMWRASVHDWQLASFERINLGVSGPSFRDFLLRRGPFPKEACLSVSVSDTKLLNFPGTFSPYSLSYRGLLHHRFGIPGITFDCDIEDEAAIKPEDRRNCFVASPEHFILIRKTDDDFLLAYQRLAGKPSGETSLSLK